MVCLISRLSSGVLSRLLLWMGLCYQHSYYQKHSWYVPCGPSMIVEIKGPESWWIGVIKGPESWWIAKSITPQLVVNQSKINPQLPSVVVDGLWIDLPLVRSL